MPLQLVSNPSRRTRRHRRTRRNPDGTFSAGSGSVASNPSRRRKHHRNPVDNPMRHHRRRVRRNPLPGSGLTEKGLGVSMEQILGGGIGFVGSEFLAGKIDDMLQGSIPTPTAPAQGNVDIMYALRRTLPRGIAAVAMYMAAKAVKLDKGFLEGIGIGGGAASASQFVAATRVLPANVLAPGSLLIGHSPMAGMPGLLPPPPAAAADNGATYGRTGNMTDVVLHA